MELKVIGTDPTSVGHFNLFRPVLFVLMVIFIIFGFLFERVQFSRYSTETVNFPQENSANNIITDTQAQFLGPCWNFERGE